MNGKIAALNRFVSRATDRCLPFFRTLRRSFAWTDECQTAFDNLKKYLLSPPLLSPSKPGEELYLYLAVSQAAISAALVREEDGSQRPVYFTRNAPRGRGEVPSDGEIGFRFDNRSTKTQTILPSAYHRCLDGQTLEKSYEQSRGSRKNGLVGSRA